VHAQATEAQDRAGDLVISGTDAPLDNPAVSLHTNLRAKVKFGFTPYEALTTATRNPAKWLGYQGQLGEIHRGTQADLSPPPPSTTTWWHEPERTHHYCC
jgi:imidazolonepropionase-like amidohydrolase